MYPYVEKSPYLGLMLSLVSHAIHNGLMSHSFLKNFLVSCKGAASKVGLEKTWLTHRFAQYLDSKAQLLGFFFLKPLGTRKPL